MVSDKASYRRVAQLAQEYVPIPHERPSGPTDALETRDSICSALRRLAVKDRQLLLMYYADGLTLREIGRVLDTSESATSLRRKALIARLRQVAKASQTKPNGKEICHGDPSQNPQRPASSRRG